MGAGMLLQTSISSRNNNLRLQHCAENCVVSAFWDAEGFVRFELVFRRTTVNAQVYCDWLRGQRGDFLESLRLKLLTHPHLVFPRQTTIWLYGWRNACHVPGFTITRNKKWLFVNVCDCKGSISTATKYSDACHVETNTERCASNTLRNNISAVEQMSCRLVNI
jgi:hypothetical protein